MLKLSKIQIDERIEKLSPILKEALFDYENFIKIENIEKNFDLNASQSEIFRKIIGRIIMGFIPLSDLEKEIFSGLAVNQEDAKKISEDLNKNIFADLKGEIEKIGQSSAPQTPVPQANIVNLKKIPAASPLGNSIPASSASAKSITNTFSPSQNLSPAPFPVINKSAPLSVNPSPLGQKNPFLNDSSSLNNPVSQPSSPLPSIKPINIPSFSSSPSPKPIEQIFSKPVSPAPFFKSQPEPIKKDFVRDFSAPFMIHEESKVEPVFRPDMIENKAIPQMNLVSNPSSGSSRQEAVKASVEIGKTRREERIAKSVSPVTAKTEPEKRIPVNYGSFSAPVSDPFSKINSAASSNSSPVSPPVSFSKPVAKKEEKEIPPSPGPSLKGNIVDFRE